MMDLNGSRENSPYEVAGRLEISPAEIAKQIEAYQNFKEAIARDDLRAAEVEGLKAGAAGSDQRSVTLYEIVKDPQGAAQKEMDYSSSAVFAK